MTQEELAHRLGVDVMTLRRWEQGKYGPKSVDEIEKAANFFEVEPWEMIMPIKAEEPDL
jgi:transcriptional regulator with XRE-family HTH domain